MLGPSILVRSMSEPTRKGKAQVAWQYHSRSDSHSKVACWTVLFDLLQECDVFRRHAADGKICFAVNHVMVGKIRKTLDLVVCRVPAGRKVAGRRDFRAVGRDFGIVLTDQEIQVLEQVPNLHEERRDDVAEVLLALEAKACMTEHSKSLPRLFAEILATGFLAKQASPACLSVAYTVVNAAKSFVSPGKGKKNTHDQPHDAQLAVEMLGSAIPTSGQFRFGYDAIGVTVIECANDGSAVILREANPAPQRHDHHHYERMIHGLCSLYRERFGTTL